MTHPHKHSLFVAHVMEPDGSIVDCIIGSEQGAPMEEVRGRFERFLAETQAPGHIVVGFHELEHEEPEPAERKPAVVSTFPQVLQRMILMGYGAVGLILMLMHWLHRRLSK
jgi:hypothetical protein